MQALLKQISMNNIISDEKYDSLWNQCRDFIDEHCIVRAEPGTYMEGKLPGSKYSWVFYLRNGLFRTDFLSAVTQMWMKKVHDEIGHFDFQLSGLETASTPMIVGIPIYAQVFGVNLNGFSIRKEQKEYAMKNWLEGGATEQPVMLMDDLSNSGNSLRKAYDILEWHRMDTFDTAFTIVNKVNEGVHDDNMDRDFMLPEHIKIMSLYTLDDFNLKGNVELH